MTKPLTAQEKAIIQQAILDRWNPHRLTWKIANHFDLSENQIRHIKSKATFKAEYARQLAIYQGSFNDIRLAFLSILSRRCRIQKDDWSMRDRLEARAFWAPSYFFQCPGGTDDGVSSSSFLLQYPGGIDDGVSFSSNSLLQYPGGGIEGGGSLSFFSLLQYPGGIKDGMSFPLSFSN